MPLGVTVSPPLESVMPLAVASLLLHTDVGAALPPPDEHVTPYVSMVRKCCVPAVSVTEPHDATTVA